MSTIIVEKIEILHVKIYASIHAESENGGRATCSSFFPKIIEFVFLCFKVLEKQS